MQPSRGRHLLLCPPLAVELRDFCILGHHRDIVKTTKRQKGQIRTSLGQTWDKPRTKKGLTKGRIDRKYNFTENSLVRNKHSAINIVSNILPGYVTFLSFGNISFSPYGLVGSVHDTKRTSTLRCCQVKIIFH